MEISGHKSKGGLLKTSETFQTLATRKKNLANIDQVYWRREHSHCSAQSQPHKQKRTIRVAQLKMSVDGKSEQNGKMCNPSSVKRQKYSQVPHWKPQRKAKRTKKGAKTGFNSRESSIQMRNQMNGSSLKNLRKSICCSTVCSKLEDSQGLSAKHSGSVSQLCALLQRTENLLTRYKNKCRQLSKERNLFKSRYEKALRIKRPNDNEYSLMKV